MATLRTILALTILAAGGVASAQRAAKVAKPTRNLLAKRPNIQMGTFAFTRIEKSGRSLWRMDAGKPQRHVAAFKGMVNVTLESPGKPTDSENGVAMQMYVTAASNDASRHNVLSACVAAAQAVIGGNGTTVFTLKLQSARGIYEGADLVVDLAGGGMGCSVAKR